MGSYESNAVNTSTNPLAAFSIHGYKWLNVAQWLAEETYLWTVLATEETLNLQVP